MAAQKTSAAPQPRQPPPQTADEIVVGGKTLVSLDRAAIILGMKSQSLASALSRGTISLTRYTRGRGSAFDLQEVEAVILKSAIPAGRRVR